MTIDTRKCVTTESIPDPKPDPLTALAALVSVHTDATPQQVADAIGVDVADITDAIREGATSSSVSVLEVT